AAARAPADGYTFYLGTLASLTTNKFLFASLPYDPETNFVPVGMVAMIPLALYVPAGSPIASIPDFVARGKREPALSLANEGPKTFGGMLARLLAARAQLQLNLVAFSSAPAAVNDAVAGQTDALLVDVPAGAPLVAAGKLRALGVTSGKRIASWPAVPALAEALPGFDYYGWIAMVAPAGTPAPAIQRFNREMDAILRDPAVADQLLKIGPITEGAGTPDSLAAFLAAERARWAKLTQEIGVLPE